MSVALFDLGQRLRAAALRRPILRSTYAPVLRPHDAIAVTIRSSHDRVLVQAATSTRATSTTGPDALSALADLGLSLADARPRTLVVADRESLSALLALAWDTDRTSPAAEVAAVVGWWAQRADHPGTGAVLELTSACAARWVVPAPPAAERHIATWRHWLGVADTGLRGLLQVADLVADGTSLPGLDAFADDDRQSWQSFVSRMTDRTSSWDWRRRDSRREAALGLASRCDANDLYESLRLGDPLIASREHFSGTVVTGVISAMPDRAVLEVTLDHLACRLREGVAVEGYTGFPHQVPTFGTGPWLRGVLGSSQVTAAERLLLVLTDVLIRPARPPAYVGQRITLRPRALDPRQQRSGRQELHRRYAARRSWLSGGPPPVPRRRDVPLEVAVAAAE